MKRNMYLLYGRLVCLLLLLGSTAWAEPIRISGTGAAISAVRQVTDAYRRHHPDVQFQFVLPPVGSSGAIKALMAQKLDVALSGRPLKKEEESAGLVQAWLGRSPFLFVVQQNAPVTRIGLSDLAEMYAGRQKFWPDGSRVRVVLRPLADADTALLKAISPAMDEAITTAHAQRAPGSALADTDTDLADMVARIPGGLGSVALTLIVAEQRPLKGLILDGAEPTVAALESNRYPYAKPLFVVTRTDAPAPVRALLDFLRSVEGKTLLSQLGISVAPQPTP
ncbi:MAG: substrate-binding domain-containing protein [Magnetococcus sp. MYC-9]